MSASDPVLDHYAQFDEDTRLTDAFGEFECARTREPIARDLPTAPAEIIDVGGHIDAKRDDDGDGRVLAAKADDLRGAVATASRARDRERKDRA